MRLRHVMASAAMDKQQLRATVKQALKALTPEQLADEGRRVIAKVVDSRLLDTAKRVGVYLYCPTLREVDTSDLVDRLLAPGAMQRCYAPLMQDRDSNMAMLHLDSQGGLQRMPPYNIPEPRPTYTDGTPREDALHMDAPLDLLLMPGLAFDRQGKRLGRGAGYYDKFIERCKQRAQERQWPPPLLAAIAFQAQIVPEVPVDDTDEGVDVIFTCNELIACTDAGKAAVEQT